MQYMRFKRSLKPFEAFDLKTKCIAWDQKWIMVEHRFVSRSDGRVKAAGICKVAVFSGGKIIPPVDAFAKLGFDTDDKLDDGALEHLLAAEKYFGKDAGSRKRD